MPLFEYRCSECGKRFTLLVGVTAEKTPLRCPKCGSRKATKLMSRIAPVVSGEEDFEASDLDDDFDADGDYEDDLD